MICKRCGKFIPYETKQVYCYDCAIVLGIIIE